MGKIKTWLEKRYLEPLDFIPFYGSWVRRERRLKEQGIEKYFSTDKKLIQGTKILEGWNYTIAFGIGLGSALLKKYLF
jgi:hypothetical protein